MRKRNWVIGGVTILSLAGVALLAHVFGASAELSTSDAQLESGPAATRQASEDEPRCPAGTLEDEGVCVPLPRDLTTDATAPSL